MKKTMLKLTLLAIIAAVSTSPLAGCGDNNGDTEQEGWSEQMEQASALGTIKLSINSDPDHSTITQGLTEENPIQAGNAALLDRASVINANWRSSLDRTMTQTYYRRPHGTWHQVSEAGIITPIDGERWDVEVTLLGGDMFGDTGIIAEGREEGIELRPGIRTTVYIDVYEPEYAEAGLGF